MKTKLVIIVMLCSMALSGCYREGKASDKTSEMVETSKTSIDMEEQGELEKSEEGHESVERTSEVELPFDFVVATEEQLASLSDADGLIDAASKVLKGIGVEEISEIVWGNYTNSSGVVCLDAYVATPKENLLFSAQYISVISSPEWSIAFVKDVVTGYYYYVPDELNETVDLYDYVTGKIVSEKVKGHEDVQNEIDEQISKAESEFEENLEELKYKTWYVSELEIDGELIMDSTVNEMVAGYDYIKDIAIKVDESRKEIGIVVQISSSASTDTAKMAGEDVARYFAAQASWATNSHRDYKAPGSDDLGGLYERYDLLIYVDDGLEHFNLYGAKVTSAKSITWK